jgi:hypothetical protein
MGTTIDRPVLDSTSAHEVLTSLGTQATRSGDEVALSFRISEGELFRVAIPFDEAVRLSAQLRKALFEEYVQR